jgi:hypothetical protein
VYDALSTRNAKDMSELRVGEADVRTWCCELTHDDEVYESQWTMNKNEVEKRKVELRSM